MPAAERAAAAAQAREENMANRRLYYGSGTDVEFDPTQGVYADPDKFFAAMNPNMPEAAPRLYTRDGQFYGSPDQRGDAADVGVGWNDSIQRMRWGGDRWDSSWDADLRQRTAFEEMAKQRGLQAGLAKYYGQDRETLEYSQMVQDYANGGWARRPFMYDENGNIVGDPEAQRALMAKLVAMTEDTGRIVTAENVGAVAGVELDVNGQWVDPRSARRAHAANHAAQMGYENVQKMYADGWRIGPNGSLIYPEQFKDVVAQKLYERTEEVIAQQGVDPDSAREIARQSLMLEGIYIPSANTAAQERFSISRRADELRRSGMDEAAAYQQAEEEIPQSAYTDLELYDWYAGGAAQRGDMTRSNAALMRNIAAGTLNNYQSYTPTDWRGIRDDIGASFASGLAGIFGADAMLRRNRLFSELKGMRPDLSDDEISRLAAMAYGRDDRGIGGKTVYGRVAGGVGSALSMMPVMSLGGSGLRLLGSIPRLARPLSSAWNALGKVPLAQSAAKLAISPFVNPRTNALLMATGVGGKLAPRLLGPGETTNELSSIADWANWYNDLDVMGVSKPFSYLDRLAESPLPDDYEKVEPEGVEYYRKVNNDILEFARQAFNQGNRSRGLLDFLLQNGEISRSRYNALVNGWE